MDETMKCSACGGEMEMVCSDDHEHGKVCKWKCKACGHEEGGATEAPAEGGGM